MKPLLKNKKGITEVFILIAIMLVLAIGFVMVIFAGQKIQEKFGGKLSELDPSNRSADPMNTMTNKTIAITDYLFLIFFVLFTLAILVTSFLVYTHPVFVIVYIILAVGGIIVSVPISNAYEKLSLVPTLSSAVAQLPIVNYMMLHLPLFVLGVIALSIIVIFAKPQLGGGQGGMGM